MASDGLRLEADEEHQHQSFRFEAWLKSFPLNRSTVLDYFAHSTFYDYSCNNQVVKMQALQDRMTTQLRNRVGLEFEVDSNTPADAQYYIVRKQNRLSPTEVQLLEEYYVVGTGVERGKIYPLPRVHDVFTCSLASSAYHITSAFLALTDPQHEKENKP